MSSTFEASYYEQNYRNYQRQNPPRKLRHYIRMIERFADPALPRRIHDIGCAFGHFLGALDGRWEIFGSDVSEYAIEQASKAYVHGTFQVASAASGPVFEQSFGVVSAFDVIEHIADLDGVTQCVHRQLAPGGLFIFVVPVYDGLSGPIIRRLDRDPTHVHKWPRHRWLDWAQASFELLRWHGIIRYLLPIGPYLHWPTRFWRRHAPAILVVCRKSTSHHLSGDSLAQND